MGVLAACGIALRFRNPWKNPRRDFSKAGSGNVFLSCQQIKSHGWRLSSVQNCEAILQSQKKSKEGFFQSRLRERYFLLAIEIELEKFKFLVKIGKKYAKFLIMCYNFLL